MQEAWGLLFFYGVDSRELVSQQREGPFCRKREKSEE